MVRWQEDGKEIKSMRIGQGVVIRPKRHLIIIPGLGDKGNLFRFFVPLWSLFGYRVHIFVFGWEQADLDFTSALGRFIAFIDTLDKGECYVIGISAGGTAAVNALEVRPAKIKKVVTVCTPYVAMPRLGNKLLKASLAKMTKTLPKLDDDARGRIVSVHARYDEVVPVAKSKPRGISQKPLLSAGHALTICLALTVYSRSIRRFMRS